MTSKALKEIDSISIVSPGKKSIDGMTIFSRPFKSNMSNIGSSIDNHFNSDSKLVSEVNVVDIKAKGKSKKNPSKFKNNHLNETRQHLLNDVSSIASELDVVTHTNNSAKSKIRLTGL